MGSKAFAVYRVLPQKYTNFIDLKARINKITGIEEFYGEWNVKFFSFCVPRKQVIGFKKCVLRIYMGLLIGCLPNQFN